jgi:spermidine/putrescine transport system permease protein
MSSGQRFGTLGLLYVVLTCAIWILLLIVAPAAMMMDFAFRPFLPPTEWGSAADVYTLANFSTALGDEFNRAIFLKTVWASVVTTGIAFVVCYPISYMLARAGRSSWVGIAMIALLVPFWINEVLRSFAWQLLLAHDGFFNHVLVGLRLVSEPVDFFSRNIGVLIGLVYTYILFMIFPMYSAMESLDQNQIEAARDLGAPWWRIHWDVVIPHAKSGLASGCIVTFMLAAGSYAVPQMLGGTRSLWFTQLIYNQFEAINWNMGAAYAMCLVVLCVAFILIMMSLFRVRLRDIAR